MSDLDLPYQLPYFLYLLPSSNLILRPWGAAAI